MLITAACDRILTSRKSADCLRAEYDRQYGFREQNALHRPYINICKTLTGYRPPDPEKVEAMWGTADEQHVPLSQVGFFDFCDLHFEVYEGQGGHLPGEIVLIDYEHRIAFTGDVFVNVHGFTAEQAADIQRMLTAMKQSLESAAEALQAKEG